MIEFSNGGVLVTDVSELPRPGRIRTLYKDLETTSRDPKLDALNPWHHCWVAGIAVTWDDHQRAYYVPVGHHDQRWNLPREAVQHWLRDLVAGAEKWTNHHVKYDVHAEYNDLRVDGTGLELTCTVVSSKLLDSDRVYKGGYGLDALAKAWLHEDIDGYGARLKPYLHKNKDYGRIPADILGDYACQDVLTNRRLDRYVTANMPAESLPVWETERAMTRVLVAMERRGLLVSEQQLKIKKAMCMLTMVESAQRLHEIVGTPVLPTSNKDCFDVLCNHFGLPVLAWTNEDDDEKASNPSFDHDALLAYQARIDAPAEVVDLMLAYRDRSTMSGLMDNFMRQGIRFGDDGLMVMHPSHNQCVRTGRMSVSDPNQMALSPEAKELVLPGPGCAFLSSDASQIEFRCIAHYTQDPKVIKAYCDDPDVDFHALVAKMCGIDRGPAKTTNFAIAFGQGRKSTVAQLGVNKKIVAAIMPVVEEMIASGEIAPDQRDDMFKRLATQRGEEVYDTYHQMFPLMRGEARNAARVCRDRGWVRNVRGRRRHLPAEHSNKAFNTLNQSSAADIIKERMVALHSALTNTGIEIVAQVHDEILMVGPTESIEDPRTTRDIVAILEDVHCLRVPLRFKYGTSRENWKTACKGPDDGGYGDKSVPLEEIREAGRLEHLKVQEEAYCG